VSALVSTQRLERVIDHQKMPAQAADLDETFFDPLWGGSSQNLTRRAEPALIPSGSRRRG
jgi:hypothetical protein